jgi:hypothetical protein
MVKNKLVGGARLIYLCILDKAVFGKVKGDGLNFSCMRLELMRIRKEK